VSRGRPAWTRRQLLGVGAGAVSIEGCVAGGRLEAPRDERDPSWREVRRRFDVAGGTLFLNNASIGLPPRAVVEEVARGYEAFARDPIAAKQDLGARISGSVLPGLAKFFGAETGELFLTRNASVALHMQALGARLSAGDEVLVTTQEHPAGLRPWKVREAREGLRVKQVFVPSPFHDPEEVITRITSAATPRTRAIAFCHVTRGGHLYPVRELARWARERDVLCLVDGAQALGMFPVDLHELGCDAYSASLHKWFLAPAGTGLLYVRRASQERIVSLFAPEGATHGAPGTPDSPVRAAIVRAIELQEALGAERIAERTRYLSDSLKEGLSELKGAKLLSGTRASSAPGTTLFELSGVDALRAVEALRIEGIHIDEHQRDGHDGIRISTHFYNDLAEIERTLRALRQLQDA